MYKLENPVNRFLEYEYNDSKEISYMVMKGTGHLENGALSSANDIIMHWREFAENALTGEHAECDLTCWSGHYDQFGRLMYHLIDVGLRKDEYVKAERLRPLTSQLLPTDDFFKNLAAGVTGTEDRIFYRCWFELIGHPNFQKSIFTTFEPMLYTHWRYIFSHLATELGYTMYRKEQGKAKFLHL